MKKLIASLMLLAACTSSESNLREDSSIPTVLPGIPRSVMAHCRDTAKVIIENAPEAQNLKPEMLACLDLKLQDRCLARMEQVAERLNKKVTPDPFFSRFPGAWDHDTVADSLDALTDHPACDGLHTKLAATQAAVAIGGRIGNQWERFDPRTPSTCN